MRQSRNDVPLRSIAFLTLGLCLLLAAWSACAVGNGTGESGEKGPYAVIRVTDVDDIVRYEVVLKDKLTERREALAADFDAAMDSYKLKTKGKTEKDQQLLNRQPQKPKITIVGTGFVKEKAAAMVEKLQRQYQEKRPSEGLFGPK